MSDGPHKSLPMPPWWRKVAEMADNPACSLSEVADCLMEATHRDLKRTLPSVVKATHSALFCDDLFESPQQALEKLRCGAIGPLPQVFLDATLPQCTSGAHPDAIISHAVAETASEDAMRGSRQIEEHYRRKSTHVRSDRIRARLAEARQLASFSPFTVDAGSGSIDSSHARGRKIGLDDGVPL